GPANRDAMSGSYFARFAVKHTDESDSYLRQAYRTLTLHTDGTFVDERTDWLLMMKMAEQYAEGGESRLLHLDDWSDLARFHHHPRGGHGFTFKGSPSKTWSGPFGGRRSITTATASASAMSINLCSRKPASRPATCLIYRNRWRIRRESEPHDCR